MDLPPLVCSLHLVESLGVALHLCSFVFVMLLPLGAKDLPQTHSGESKSLQMQLSHSFTVSLYQLWPADCRVVNTACELAEQFRPVLLWRWGLCSVQFLVRPVQCTDLSGACSVQFLVNTVNCAVLSEACQLCSS